MPKIRWLLIWLCFLANAIGYIDRANLAIAAKGIQAEMGIDPAQMGLILSAFFWTYAFMQMPAGWVVDRIGVRISLTVAVVWWSLFTMATGAARTVSHFIAARLMLGLGESATMPSFTKTAFNCLLQSRHSDHEELVEIRREDRQELQPLQQRVSGIECFFEYSIIEVNPTQFAIDEEMLLLSQISRLASFWW